MNIVRSDMLAEMEFGALTLAEPYGRLLGPIERKTGVFVWGPEGSGKSTFCLGLARALVPHALAGGGTVLYASREEGPDRKTRDRQRRLGAEHPALLISDFTTTENLKAAIEEYGVEFVVIDSVSALNIGTKKAEELVSWLQERETGIVCVAHANAQGRYKGQTDLPHMLDVVVKCYAHGEGAGKAHVAETTKNRYAPLTAIRIPMAADEIGDDPPMDLVREENAGLSDTPKTPKAKEIFRALERRGLYTRQPAAKPPSEASSSPENGRSPKAPPAPQNRPSRENAEQAPQNATPSGADLIGTGDLVFLGFCTLVVTSEARFSGQDFLFSTVALDRLIVVPAEQVRLAGEDAPHPGAEAAFEEWHRYAPDGTDFELDLDLSAPEPVGTAQRIEYSSDKMARPGDAPGVWNDYYHDFTEAHQVVQIGEALVVAPDGTLKINQDGLLGIVN